MKFIPSSESFSGNPDGFSLDQAESICKKIQSLDSKRLDELLDITIPKSRIFTPSSGISDIRLHEIMYNSFNATIFPALEEISHMTPESLAKMYYDNNDSWPFIETVHKKWYASGIMPNDYNGIASTLRMRNLPMCFGQLATNVVGRQINGYSLRDAGWGIGHIKTLSDLCRYTFEDGPGCKRANEFSKKWDEFNKFCERIFVKFFREYDKLDQSEPRTDSEILEDVEESMDGDKLYSFSIFGEGLDSLRYQYWSYLVGKRDDHSDMMYCDAAMLLKFIDSRLG
jgi:hypothetical protein